jgi:hypothetical protein
MQQIMGLLQQIVENPQGYPQILQQIVRMGGNPEDFPPPNTPPEQLVDFASGIMLVIYYMGKLGQAGQQQQQGGGQVPPPQGGGQVPPGVQGYPEGGIVGQGPQQEEFNQFGQRNIGLQQMNFANQQAQFMNNAAPMDQGAGTQALNTGGTPPAATTQIDAQPTQNVLQPTTSEGINATGNVYGTTTVPGVGKLYSGADLVQPWLTERDLLRKEYGQTNQYKGLRKVADVTQGSAGVNMPLDWGGRRTSMRQNAYKAASANAGQGKTDPFGAAWTNMWHNQFQAGNKYGAYGGSPVGFINYTPDNLNPTVTRAGGQGGIVTKMTSPITPDNYYRTNYGDNRSTPGFQQYGGHMSGGHTIDPWQMNEPFKSASPHAPTYYSTPARYGWFDDASQRLYPVRTQEQLNEYVKGYTHPNENVDQFRSGKPYWKTGYGDQFRHRTAIGGPAFSAGGMVGAPHSPIQTNTGDDQLIAAKTGEAVLNQEAVAALGGPEAVNQINYQASGKVPGGRPVKGGMAGYNYGGNVERPEDDPNFTASGALAKMGYAHGGIVGDHTATTNANYVWSEAAQKYVAVSRDTKKFSGRVLKAMGFLG